MTTIALGGTVVGPSVVRGMPSRTTESQEMLQRGYLYAISAASGCNVWKAEVDEGIDAMISHRAMNAGEVFLQVQMKATGASASISKTHITAKMSRKRFREFADPSVTINKIVVIMGHPAAQQFWVSACKHALSVRNCAYWVNLRNIPEPPGTGEYVTVKAPLGNVFDDIALCQIMARIGAGGTP